MVASHSLLPQPIDFVVCYANGQFKEFLPGNAILAMVGLRHLKNV